MSVKAVNYVKAQARAGGFAQAVLLFLADCHNADSGQCNPSRETIREFFSSEDEQCSMKRIDRALKELRDKGFIRSVKRACKSGVLNWYEIVGLAAEGSPQNGGGNRNRNRKEPEEVADAPLALVPVSHSEPEKNKKGSRITFTELTPELREQAMKVCPDLSPEQVAYEFDCFLDYWRAKAGAGGVKRDWAATWRNWIRRRKQFGWTGGRQLVSQTPAVDEFKQAVISKRKYEEEEAEAAELFFG